jgi:hypothetical protein
MQGAARVYAKRSHPGTNMHETPNRSPSVVAMQARRGIVERRCTLGCIMAPIMEMSEDIICS